MRLDAVAEVRWHRVSRDGGDEQEIPARAWLEMREARHARYERDAGMQLAPGCRCSESPRVSAGEWVRVSGRLRAEYHDGLQMIFLAMDGAGRAFFSELLVHRI